MGQGHISSRAKWSPYKVYKNTSGVLMFLTAYENSIKEEDYTQSMVKGR